MTASQRLVSASGQTVNGRPVMIVSACARRLDSRCARPGLSARRTASAAPGIGSFVAF
ncbi:hypothetical protein ACFXG4_52310 [Nocardia sp. NPDC059246]|uniref:hypothetical protein n=1 Tax=unclassified Nocardia TaxID=2637762 RepID=UPI003683596D